MRITITTLLLVLAYMHPLSADAKIPDWYNNLPSEDYEVIGYGSGPDEGVAKEYATDEVAKRVSDVIVKSETETTTKDKDGERSIERKEAIRTLVKARLSGVIPIKREKIRRTWYVAVKYDNSTAMDKVIREFKEVGCGHEFPYSSTEFDSLIEFSRRVKEKLLCVPDWDLEYHQQIRDWFLDVTSSGDQHRQYRLRIDEFKNYIPDRRSANLEVRPSKESVMESKEGYYLAIDNNREGWLYLFNVTEEGQSILMKSFGWMGPGKGRKYPANDMELKADLPKELEAPSAREYYLAVLCHRETDFREHRIGQEVPDRDDPDTYGFGRLLRDIRSGNCDVAGSRLIVHREKK